MPKKSSYTPRKPPALESRSKKATDGVKPVRTQPRTGRKKKRGSSGTGGFWSFLKKLVRWTILVGTAVLAWIYFTLPDIDDLNHFEKNPSVVVKAENGQIIGSFGDIYGDYIPYEELPRSLIDAMLATEDRNFFYHFGIDPIGLTRAMIANMRAGHVVQGGSTITQQVAKNVFLTPERSLLRKIREAMLAIKLEIRFSKQDIMAIYANRVYLGAGSYGVDAASRRYFDKSARDLTLSESAILAGLLKAPSRFSPTNNAERSRKRAEQVLRNMEAAEYLTKTQADNAIDALAATMKNRVKSSQSSLYFADWIMDQLPDLVGNMEEDLVVTSTLDPDWQNIAEKTISDALDKNGEKMGITQAALVAMAPDGAVRSMIGGRSYSESQYNRTVQSLRQPGSSFKLFVYLAGLENGLTPSSMVEDEPITIPIVGGKWTPKNYTGRYEGPIPLSDAVAQSINTVAVRVSQEVGIDRIIDVAQRLGISAPMDAVPSLALGSTEVSLLEMTGAYAHLAANGRIVYPYGIIQIDTRNGDTLYRRQPPPSGFVLRADVVGMMNEMLMGVIDHGTGAGAKIGRPAAGKTGTTSDYKDALFIGYTPDLVTGVWVGNDDNTPMKKVTGGTLPAPIWRDFMAAALAETPIRDIPTSNVPAPLPWQADLTQPEAPAEPAANEDEPLGPKLGESFWDKLLR